MERVLAAARAILAQFQPRWIVPPILLGGVILFFTLCTGQSNRQPDCFRLLCHENPQCAAVWSGLMRDNDINLPSG